ncbi:SA1002 family membrane protein [Limosilactobacillus sp.]|jgi:hypothetical protein|uniref:SA1002 family membrane protein n=1 Tax=Limosilactobacillus sp. TaxID=2773925 RepID=UPI0025C4FA15|nr:hypothetical protein [Limosilactobacillus sp.]MCH3922918.1 hypothetical protein [Limosilactobacillus sp.]MCH3927601.1 hypothetical protein [Limosilactobacillus sp.]
MKVTDIFIPIIILAIVVLLLREGDRRPFIAAAVLFLSELVFSTLNFMLFFELASGLLRRVRVVELGNLFLLLAIFVVLSGMLLYAGMRMLRGIIRFTSTVLTMVEYYIQWSLIYVTVYQAIFANAKKVQEIGHFIKVGKFLDPNLFVVIVLPSFISAWIAVVLYKKYIQAI